MIVTGRPVKFGLERLVEALMISRLLRASEKFQEAVVSAGRGKLEGETFLSMGFPFFDQQLACTVFSLYGIHVAYSRVNTGQLTHRNMHAGGFQFHSTNCTCHFLLLNPTWHTPLRSFKAAVSMQVVVKCVHFALGSEEAEPLD